jgi:GT2 family glycosyltransferase
LTAHSPLVSIIIPCFNAAGTLPLCLRAVAEQTYAPVEVIVVDDGSTDGSASSAEAAGATVLRRSGNGGPSVARNLGAARARGEILFFLDADVALAPGSVAAAVAALRADPDLAAVSGVYDVRPLLADTRAARYRALQMHLWWMREGPHAGPHTALFAIRAAAFHEIGPFHPGLRHTEPQEYGQRLRRRHRMYSTAAVHGRHAHEPSLRVLLPKVFRRARASALEWRPGEPLGGTHGAPARSLSSGLVLLAVIALPLPVWLGAAGALGSPALVAAAVALDAGTYRQVIARHGPAFAGYFLAAHAAFQLTAALGAVAGAARRSRGRAVTAAPPPVRGRT